MIRLDESVPRGSAFLLDSHEAYDAAGAASAINEARAASDSATDTQTKEAAT